MDLVTKRRGVFREQALTSPGRVQLTFELPLAELIVDFYDKFKSARADMHRSITGFSNTARGISSAWISTSTRIRWTRSRRSCTARRRIAAGNRWSRSSRILIPRQQFVVPVQAVAGGRVISRANVKGLRKDVLAKCYGGDITRKRKLLEKQKRGKKRMKMVGAVEVPQEAFMAVLGMGNEE